MPGFGDSKAWIFLDNIYAVAGIKNYFDATALHPYARDINEFRSEITMFRASMTNHDDAATALWLTEWGWGSGPPDQFGHNVGLAGQQRCSPTPSSWSWRTAASGTSSGCIGSCGGTPSRAPFTPTCAASAAPGGC